MSADLDDDEVLVYDWRNAGVPRPAGTTRLGDGGSHSSQMLWNGWPPTPSPAFQSNSVGLQNHHYSTSGNWFDQMTAHQMQYGYPLPYNNQYQAMYGHSLPAMPYPTYASPAPGAYYHNGDYSWGNNYYYDQGRALQAQVENQVAPKKPKKKVVVEESKDSDLFDVEEFDYSGSKYRSPEPKSTKEKQVNKSRNETTSPTDDSFQVEEIDYSIPLPTVPLNEILPGFGSKAKSPSKAPSQGSGSRKRPRTELETELVDLMSKKGGRASARSYAKPSRKVSTPPAPGLFPTPASSTSSIGNEDVHCTLRSSSASFPSASTLPAKSQSPDKCSRRQPTPELDVTSQSEANISMSTQSDASANQSFEEVRPTIIDTSLNDVESEAESEIMECQIKIRSDIFEDEDEED